MSERQTLSLPDDDTPKELIAWEKMLRLSILEWRERRTTEELKDPFANFAKWRPRRTEY